MDSGRGGVVAFSPLRGYNAHFFSISNNGVVAVAERANLDWETINEFYFTVEVRSTTPVASSKTVMHIPLLTLNTSIYISYS